MFTTNKLIFTNYTLIPLTYYLYQTGNYLEAVVTALVFLYLVITVFRIVKNTDDIYESLDKDSME